MKMAQEKILETALTIAAAGPVTAVWDNQKVKVLASLDEGVNKSISGFRRHVVVQFTDNQHEMPLQARRVVDVGTLGVLWADGVTHPLLIPRSLVHAIVMAAAISDSGFV